VDREMKRAIKSACADLCEASLAVCRLVAATGGERAAKHRALSRLYEARVTLDALLDQDPYQPPQEPGAEGAF